MSAYWQAEASFDWDRYVGEQGGEKASRTRPEYLLTCSKCQKEKLAVNPKRRRWRCFTCNEGGRDAASLISQAEGLPWYAAIQAVLSGSQYSIGPLDQITTLLEQPADRPANWVPVVRRFPDGFEDCRASFASSEYARKRGISDEVCDAMGLGYCHRGRFRGRLVFPVRNELGQWIFYQGRASWDVEKVPKLPNHSDSFRRAAHVKTLSCHFDPEKGHAGASDVLLNLDQVIQRGFKRIAVVEGPVDCAHAFPDCVAAFGKVLSGRQIELLMRAGVTELDLCFDAEALQDMFRVAPVLADLFIVRVVRLPAGKDPGDLSKPQIDHHRLETPVWGSGDRLRQLHFPLRQ